MRIDIFNTISAEKDSRDLTGAEILIGRSVSENGDQQTNNGASTISLPSRHVSKLQAVMSKVDGAWTLRHCGSTETLLNREPLYAGRLYPLRNGDHIRIGIYELSIIDQSSVTASIQKDVFGESQIMAMEKRLHGDLLDVMDLRRGERAVDLKAEATRTRILDQLERIIQAEFASMSSDEIKAVAKVAVYRSLSKKVTASGGSVREDGASFFNELVGGRAKVQLDRIIDKLISTLELAMEPKALEQDSHRVDDGFDAAYRQCELDLSPGLRSEIGAGYIKRNILDLIFGLGPIQDLMEMESISEIMVVSKDQIFIEKFGVVEDSRRAFFSDGLLLATIERIVTPIGRRIDKSSPMVDAHLPDGSRVNAIIPPLALKGPCLTIRKFSKTPLGIDDLVGFGALSRQMARFLSGCVEGQKNIVVSGGTGSGKTTLLNCISAFIPRKERIVTIEDTAELQLQQEHVITLEARPANMEGKGEITIRDLVKNALRMRPDRVVIGECRGAEALDMLQAMNTGHDGSMTTGHANTPADMMRRIETMILTGNSMPVAAIREQIVSAVDIVVQLNRFSNGSRKITDISEVVGIDADTGQVITEDIFHYTEGASDANQECARHTGYVPTFMYELLEREIMELDVFLGQGSVT